MYKGLLLTRTKVVRLPERAQKNVLFSLYDVGFLFVPSSAAKRINLVAFWEEKKSLLTK